jgi:hypothetical protein
MQYSFSTDPTLGERLFDVLDTVFPGLRQVAANARTLGAPWESVSTPFIVREGARVLSHVGVIELSLIVLGERFTVGSIHGVATHPTVDAEVIIAKLPKRRFTIVTGATPRRSSRLNIRNIFGRSVFALCRNRSSLCGTNPRVTGMVCGFWISTTHGTLPYCPDS